MPVCCVLLLVLECLARAAWFPGDLMVSQSRYFPFLVICRILSIFFEGPVLMVLLTSLGVSLQSLIFCL